MKRLTSFAHSVPFEDTKMLSSKVMASDHLQDFSSGNVNGRYFRGKPVMVPAQCAQTVIKKYVSPAGAALIIQTCQIVIYANTYIPIRIDAPNPMCTLGVGYMKLWVWNDHVQPDSEIQWFDLKLCF